MIFIILKKNYNVRKMLIYEILFIMVISSFLGIFMKISDLLDEHGYKWFRYADIITGIIWGILCSILIAYNEILAILWLSVILGFLIRGRIDYRNHSIAVAICFLTALFMRPNFFANLFNFFYLFLLLSITGMVHDYIEYKNRKVNMYIKRFFYDYHLHWYTIITIYLILTKDIITFVSLVTFSYFYGLIASGKLECFIRKIGIHK